MLINDGVVASERTWEIWEKKKQKKNAACLQKNSELRTYLFWIFT
jgi:hypothetical protein